MENSLTETQGETGATSDTSLVDMFESAETATDVSRALSELSRDYYDSKQWTAAEMAELQRRGQPVITNNIIAGKVNWLLGQEMGRRTDPKAFPRTPQHEQGADAVTDAVRFVCDNQNWNETRSQVWENMLIEGFGGVDVIHKDTPKGVEIVIEQYPWDRLFFDPHSRKHDFSDAKYKGAVIWADSTDVVREYPDAREAIGGLLGPESTSGDTYDDRPADATWGDRQQNRVRIVVMHYLEGDVWKWAKFTKGYVFERGDSPYVNDDDESVCSLLMQSAYVDRENNRYGEVSKTLSLQDEVNKRRSKLLHFGNSRQTMSVKGAVGSVAALKRELAKPDGHVEYEAMDDSGRPSFQVMNTTDMASSQIALLGEAKDAINDMGASEALMGASDGDSGRAVLAKQQGAMQGITPLNDKLHQFTRRVYEAIWFRIRQFWTEEKWVRVTDDERNVRFVGLNRPVTLAEELSQMPREQVQQYAMQNRLVPNDPRLQQVVRVENQIERLDVDLIMEEVPDTITLEAETFEQLVNIDAARGGVLPIEMLIEASPLRSKVKTKILEHFEQQKEAEAQQGQQGQGVQEQMLQLEIGDRQSEIDKNQTQAAKNQADAMKTTVEARRLALGY